MIRLKHDYCCVFLVTLLLQRIQNVASYLAVDKTFTVAGDKL